MTLADSRLLTSLRPDYAHFLTNESKRRKTTKRRVIEDMFALYIEKHREDEMRKEYAKMTEDDEYISESRVLAREYLGVL